MKYSEIIDLIKNSENSEFAGLLRLSVLKTIL
mgnify:CR=1 FL=1